MDTFWRMKRYLKGTRQCPSWHLHSQVRHENRYAEYEECNYIPISMSGFPPNSTIDSFNCLFKLFFTLGPSHPIWTILTGGKHSFDSALVILSFKSSARAWPKKDEVVYWRTILSLVGLQYLQCMSNCFCVLLSSCLINNHAIPGIFYIVDQKVVHGSMDLVQNWVMLYDALVEPNVIAFATGPLNDAWSEATKSSQDENDWSCLTRHSSWRISDRLKNFRSCRLFFCA